MDAFLHSQDLKAGATLQTVKQTFRKTGITSMRTSMERSLPFGIGLALGGAAKCLLGSDRASVGAASCTKQHIICVRVSNMAL